MHVNRPSKRRRLDVSSTRGSATALTNCTASMGELIESLPPFQLHLRYIHYVFSANEIKTTGGGEYQQLIIQPLTNEVVANIKK